MFGLSLFRPSRQSNISTSGEERFKYPSPGRTRSVKCPTPGLTKTIKSPPRALPPPRLYIYRCIRLKEKFGVRKSDPKNYPSSFTTHKWWTERKIWGAKIGLKNKNNSRRLISWLLVAIYLTPNNISTYYEAQNSFC